MSKGRFVNGAKKLVTLNTPLVSGQYCFKHFPCINSFNPPQNPMRQVLSSLPNEKEKHHDHVNY